MPLATNVTTHSSNFCGYINWRRKSCTYICNTKLQTAQFCRERGIQLEYAAIVLKLMSCTSICNTRLRTINFDGNVEGSPSLPFGCIQYDSLHTISSLTLFILLVFYYLEAAVCIRYLGVSLSSLSWPF